MDLHIHSIYSDGSAGINEIARKARERGLRLIAIVDHSSDHQKGLNEKKAIRRKIEIENAQERFGIRILDGVECGILEDGKIVMPEHHFELVIASLHAYLPVNEVYRRLKKCMVENSIDILGHVHAGMFSHNSPIPEYDLEIIDLAKENRVAVELNSYHMSPPEDFLKLCRGKDILYSFGSDAHHLSMVGKLDFSIRMAKIYFGNGKNLAHEIHNSDG